MAVRIGHARMQRQALLRGVRSFPTTASDIAAGIAATDITTATIPAALTQRATTANIASADHTTPVAAVAATAASGVSAAAGLATAVADLASSTCVAAASHPSADEVRQHVRELRLERLLPGRRPEC